MFSPRAKAEGSTRKNAQITVPAPLKGLQAVRGIANMDPLSALVLDNFVCYPNRVATRQPRLLHVQATVTPQALALFPWNGTAASKLFAVTRFPDDGEVDRVYDVTTAGSPGLVYTFSAPGLTMPVGAQLNTGAGSFLLLSNTAGDAVRYDGATWTSVPSFGSLAGSAISGMAVYKQRLFMLEKESMTLWYLPVNSIGGSATSYPLGAIFRNGGKLACLSTWTVDAGYGPDDMLVVMSSEGEVAVFSGTDPGNPATWALAGVYNVGKPLGANCMYKLGADLLILCEWGVYPLTAALRGQNVDRSQAITDSVQAIFADAVREIGTSALGWCLAHKANVPVLLVNLPFPRGARQLCYNLQSRRWTTFSGWDMWHMVPWNGGLYSACRFPLATDFTFEVHSLLVDDWTTESVTATMLQAYSNLGYDRTKQAREVRTQFTSDLPFSYSFGLYQDYSRTGRPTAFVPASGGFSVWGTGTFGSAVWGGSLTTARNWQVIADNYSTHKAVFCSIQANFAEVQYDSCDLLLSLGGTF